MSSKGSGAFSSSGRYLPDLGSRSWITLKKPDALRNILVVSSCFYELVTIDKSTTLNLIETVNFLQKKTNDTQTNLGCNFLDEDLCLSGSQTANKGKQMLIICVGDSSVHINTNLVSDINKDLLKSGEQFLLGHL